MIPAVIWFLQVAWYCLSIFFRSICSFPAKRFGTMSCFYSLGSISALCVTVFIMYFLSHRMQQAAQNFDSAAVPPPIPCPGNPQQAGLYNYPAYRTRSHKNDPSLPQKDALLLMLLVNQASHRQCSRKKHRLIDTVTSCHSKPPKKKTSNFKDRALALRRQFRQGGQVAKHLNSTGGNHPSSTPQRIPDVLPSSPAMLPKSCSGPTDRK